MKKRFLLLLCCLAIPAFADELNLTDEDCRAITEYQPAPDVDYKSGVDADGRPVLEADVTPPVITLPDTYKVPLTADLLRGDEGRGRENDAVLGEIEIDKSGAMSFNGRPLEGDAAAALKAACAARDAAKQPQKRPKRSK